MKRHLWLSALLSTSAALAEPHPLRLEAGVGGLVQQQAYLNFGASTDGFGAAYVNARTAFSWVGVEGDVLMALPFSGLGPYGSATVTLRAGYQGERLSVLAGPVAIWGYGAPVPVQWLPSVSARYRFDRWSLSGGLVNLHALALAHVSADIGAFTFGFVAPLGGHVGYRFKHPSLPVVLNANLLAVGVFAERHALFTIGATYGEAP